MSIVHARTSEPKSADVLSVPQLDAAAIIKRDSRTVSPDPMRIVTAIEMAFRAEIGVPFPDPLRAAIHTRAQEIATATIVTLNREYGSEAVHVESIQDEVERQLMAAGAFGVAKRYIIYREARSQQRHQVALPVVDDDGRPMLLYPTVLRSWIEEVCSGYEPHVSSRQLLDDVMTGIYPGIRLSEIELLIAYTARSKIELDPAWSFVASRSLLRRLYSEAADHRIAIDDVPGHYRELFENGIREAVKLGMLDERLLSFDLARLADALQPERDRSFTYLGLQTLYDRYLIRDGDRRIEIPQTFWMRVAMGLAIEEADRDARAIEFYELMSTYRFCPSTPTLFNAGTRHPQLSSCYLTTIADDLDAIFGSLNDNALLSKWSGGLGNDWTRVRALGSLIKGTNGLSQGIVPFLKVANDAAVAVNQGGKRKGAVCAYLETWHLDIEEFLDLRKNTGDDRRRTHDMNTAHWVPDLFMQRVAENGDWTLFSPDEVPDLHETYGRAFEQAYLRYEQAAARGELRLHRTIRATDLWRKMLTALFETGHPWITFKDPSNLRSPQDHAGVVHNSNLCTEILLNTSDDEIAVCNLGSVNLVPHIHDGALDLQLLESTVRTAMRMLDNIIDINFYPVPEARNANLRHRPVGLGIMGFQDALYAIGTSYSCPRAVEFASISTEAVSYFALLASTELAAERGTYSSYTGSKWDRGLLPVDTIELLSHERGTPVEVDIHPTLDWNRVRTAIRRHGMRNSNTMAIAPTATISNIVGVSQSIEPLFSNLYVKSNLSGEFTMVNDWLIADLKARGLWDQEMLDDLKHTDGSVQDIVRIPDDLKERYQTAFETDPRWLVDCAAHRQIWIDQGQSLNLYATSANGRAISEMYLLAWRKGIKTTYYLRNNAATQLEKSTIDINARGLQPRWMKSTSPSAAIHVQRDDRNTVESFGERADTFAVGASCLLDEGCEVCQ